MAKKPLPVYKARGHLYLLFVICGMVTIFVDDTIYLFCSVLWLFVWIFGCGKRGEKYWPVVYAERRFQLHFVLMLCVMAILVGIALRNYSYLLGAFFALSIIMFILSLDLIFNDTKDKYEGKIQLNKQIQHDNTNTNRSVSFRWLNSKFINSVLLLLTLVVIFVAEYKNLVLQLKEWLSLLSS